jgi:hypothetical protein
MKMMKARYGSDAFVLHATKINNVIYYKFIWIDKFEQSGNKYVMIPEVKIQAKRNVYNDTDPSRYGRKFEQYLLSGKYENIRSNI